MDDIRDLEKKKKAQSIAVKRSASVVLDVKALDVLPRVTATKRQLYNAAKATGHALYDTSASGLIWDASSSDDAHFERTNTYRCARKNAEIMGEDAVDYETFQPPDFSYVFFPSRFGAGLDVGEKMHFVRDRKKMADVDGNIYLVDNISGTSISVINPTLTTKQSYIATVSDVLQR